MSNNININSTQDYLESKLETISKGIDESILNHSQKVNLAFYKLEETSKKRKELLSRLEELNQKRRDLDYEAMNFLSAQKAEFEKLKEEMTKDLNEAKDISDNKDLSD